MEQEEVKILKEQMLDIKNRQNIVDELRYSIKKEEKELTNERKGVTKNLNPQQYSARVKQLLSMKNNQTGKMKEIYKLQKVVNRQLSKNRRLINERKQKIRARNLKKHVKIMQLEREQQEIQRLQEAFIYGHVLSCFQDKDVRSDFLKGENGAIKLTDEQLSQLDQLFKLIEPGQPTEQSDITSHYYVLAKNHIFLVQGKNKEIAGTTYKTLKKLFVKIKECRYFSGFSAEADASSIESGCAESDASSDDMPNDQETIGIVSDYTESDSYSNLLTSSESDASSDFKPYGVRKKPSSYDMPNDQPDTEFVPQETNGIESDYTVSDASSDFKPYDQRSLYTRPSATFASSSYPASPPVEENNNSVVESADAAVILMLQPVLDAPQSVVPPPVMAPHIRFINLLRWLFS